MLPYALPLVRERVGAGRAHHDTQMRPVVRPKGTRGADAASTPAAAAVAGTCIQTGTRAGWFGKPLLAQALPGLGMRSRYTLSAPRTFAPVHSPTLLPHGGILQS
jgi:hypothetical protein